MKTSLQWGATSQKTNELRIKTLSTLLQTRDPNLIYHSKLSVNDIKQQHQQAGSVCGSRVRWSDGERKRERERENKYVDGERQ